MRVLAIVMAGILAASLALVASQEKPQRVTGFFSDMSYDAEVGDIAGTEIFIVHASDDSRYYAYLQFAEGVTFRPYSFQPSLMGGE